QNRKIDALMGRQLRRCSTRIDINALATNFDQKRQRFTTDPVSRTLWRARTMHFVLVERHLAKKAIMRRRQHTNFHGPIRRASPTVTASPDEAPARFARSTAEGEAMRR